MFGTAHSIQQNLSAPFGLSDNLARGKMQLHEPRKRVTLQFGRLGCRRQEQFIMLVPNASTFRFDQNNPDGQQ